MNEGTIGKWFFSENDTVVKGEPIVEVITDKTVFEFEAPKSGLLRKIVAPEGSVIPPGYVLAFIGKIEDELPDVEDSNRRLLDSYLKELAVSAAGKPAGKKQKPAGNSGGGKVRATPSAKRLAREYKLDLSEIQAMFNAQVINEKVVEEYLAKRK